MGFLDFLFGKKTLTASDKKLAEQHIVAGPKPIDWRQSEAHMSLLRHFLLPQDLSNVKQFNYLESKLGELPRFAVDRYISEDLLVPSSLSGKLLAAFNAAAIKDLLRQRKLPVSGNKEQGIARLVKADFAGLESLVSHLAVYECSTEAREIASRFAEEEEALQQAAEQRSMEQLQQKDFNGAMVTVASFEAKQVSPRGINVDWNNHDLNSDAAVLNAIFEHRPNILAGIVDAEWKPLCLAAAMMHLWGTNRASKWLPVGFVGVSKFNKDTAIRMILFHAQHQVAVNSWRKNGSIKKVEILGSGDSCPACKKITEKRYDLEEVPELPHEHCSHEMGCRCEALPIL